MRKWMIGVLCVGMSTACGDGAPPGASPGAPELPAASVAGNHAPLIESLRLEPTEPVQGGTLEAVVLARDPDGQAVTLIHHWFVDGAEQPASERTLSLERVGKHAQIRVVVTASDGVLTSQAAEATTRVIDRPPRMASLAIGPAQSVPPGEPVRVGADAADLDGDPIDYEYTWYVNDERRDASGPVFATDGLKSGDAVRAEVRASDGASWTDPMRSDVVTIAGGHPVITSTPPGLRDDGVFRYQVVATDPDGDKRLRYQLEKGPDGMTIDNVLGGLEWRPSTAKPGVYPVVVVVRDSGGLETKQLFSVTVQQKVETVAAPAGRHIRVRGGAEAAAAPASNGD